MEVKPNLLRTCRVTLYARKYKCKLKLIARMMNASQVELVDARHELGDVGVLRVQVPVAVATMVIVVVVMLVNIVAGE